MLRLQGAYAIGDRTINVGGQHGVSDEVDLHSEGCLLPIEARWPFMFLPRPPLYVTGSEEMHVLPSLLLRIRMGYDLVFKILEVLIVKLMHGRQSTGRRASPAAYPVKLLNITLAYLRHVGEDERMGLLLLILE